MYTREFQVLSCIIETYIKTAEPVGSRFLAKTNFLDLSSASIRNIMADLTDLNLISQPHTSAGRMPTDKGYRLYVNNMLKQNLKEIPLKKEPLNDKVKVDNLKDILSKATKLLARATKLTSIISSPKPLLSRMQHIHFAELTAQKILVTIVAQNGMVINKVIFSKEILGQKFLNSVSRYLNRLFKDYSFEEIQNNLIKSLVKEKSKYDDLLGQVIRFSKRAFHLTENSDLYIHGQTNMLHYPEFTNLNSLETIYRALEHKTKILDIMMKMANKKDIQILIGKEHQCDGLEECSIIVANYGVANSSLGTIGIIGPRRMDYARNISIIKNIAARLSSEIKNFIL